MPVCFTVLSASGQETSWKRQGGEEQLGVWNSQKHTAVYRLDYQQGPTYSTGNYTEYLVITDKGEESEKKKMCVPASLCCTLEPNTAL